MATAACAVSGTVQGAAFGGASTKIWNYEKGPFCLNAMRQLTVNYKQSYHSGASVHGTACA